MLKKPAEVENAAKERNVSEHGKDFGAASRAMFYEMMRPKMDNLSNKTNYSFGYAPIDWEKKAVKEVHMNEEFMFSAAYTSATSPKEAEEILKTGAIPVMVSPRGVSFVKDLEEEDKSKNAAVANTGLNR